MTAPRPLTTYLSFVSLLFVFTLIGRTRAIGAAQSSINPEVIAHFQAGQQALRASRFQLAIQEYKIALRLKPSMIQAQVNLGLAYHSSGHYSLAAAEFKGALRHRPNLLAANLFLGLDYLKLGQTAKAIPFLETALRIDASDLEARHALVASYEAQSNYIGAVKQFHVISSHEPNPIEATYYLGLNYYDLAMYLVGRLSRHYSDSAWANRLGGDLLADQHFWADAAVRYQQALKIEPSQPGLRVSLGEMYVRQGKYKDAGVQFERDLEHDPENEGALLGMAEVDLAAGSVRQALECISSIWKTFAPFLAQHKEFPLGQFAVQRSEALADSIEAAPDGPAKQYLLSCLYRISGQNKNAERNWKAMESNLHIWRKKFSKSRNGQGVANTCGNHRYLQCAMFLQNKVHLTDEQFLLLGKALLALRQYTNAVESFAAILSRTPDDLEASYWLARSCIGLADSYFSDVVSKFPESWRAYELRGRTDEVRGKYGDAIHEYQEAERLHPGTPELLEGLARAYLGVFRLAPAETELRKTLEMEPTNASVLYLLGRVCLLRHDTQGGIQYFRAALHYDPNFLKARAGLGQAYMREGKVTLARPQLVKAASIDRFGDIHYLLYLAYLKLGENGAAGEALRRSQELRKTSASRHEARVAAAFEEQNFR